jgi:hypothetical protein
MAGVCQNDSAKVAELATARLSTRKQLINRIVGFMLNQVLLAYTSNYCLPGR